jgi:hypothetical protein
MLRVGYSGHSSLPNAEFQLKNTQREVEKLSRNVTQLKNKKSQKLALLERENRDTYQGVLWLKVEYSRH